ncbi:MAG TPA: hypothetical protein VMS17_27730 [Gemmataceae bacterium]|nr:hypothetical protein [Gemmataceae bacterium]
MAETKSTSAAAPQGNSATPGKKMSKMEAVRRALRKLGRDAKPLPLQAHIKKEFGIDMSTDHISTYKGDIARKKAKRFAAKRAAKAAGAAPTMTEHAKPAGKGAVSYHLEDVLTAKELLERVGAERLRTLINGLAK